MTARHAQNATALGITLFVAFVAATSGLIFWALLHEPFYFDAWNVAVDTNSEPITASKFFAYVVDQYQHSNPRFGQILTYLAYKTVYVAPIVAPLAFVSVGTSAFVIGTRRLPSLRSGKDLALLAIAIGFGWIAMPQIGKIMFCSAYSANYLWAGAIQLWFVAVLVLHVATPAASSPTKLVVYGVLGLVSGMCNEHTGPTILASGLVVIWWLRKSGHAFTFVAAGLAGFLVGFLAIFFAPGQDQRYEGLATKVGFFGRLWRRGISGNLDILRDFLAAAGPVLLVIALLLAFHFLRNRTNEQEQASKQDTSELASRLRFVGLALVAGTMVTATLFVSPKLGPRFFLHAMVVLTGAMIGVAELVLRSRKQLASLLVVVTFALGYAGYNIVRIYSSVSRDSDQRMAQLAAAKPGEVLTIESWDQIEDSWWFQGDDFRDLRKREMVTKYLGLGGIIFRSYQNESPLGVSDVELVPSYQLDPPGCLDQVGALRLDSFRGFDITSVQGATKRAIESLVRRLPSDRNLRSLTIEVSFAGDRPALPRPKLVLAGWEPTKFTAYAAVINRGAGKTRTLVLPPELVAQPSPLEVYLYHLGGKIEKLGTTTSSTFSFKPWHAGMYWALACDSAQCWVVATAHYKI